MSWSVVRCICPRGWRSSPAALERFGGAGGEVIGVLVGHTHFDHAVDAPAIARRFGCRAYGSDSLLNLMGLHGLAESAVVVEPYRTYELGPFVVRFTPSVHSKLLLGLAVPYDGELTCDHLGQPLEFVSNVQLSELPNEIGAVSGDIELAALPRSNL